MELKIKDIAKKAGVSVTAVSFALNGKGGISDKTRQKILRIVEEEGYTSKSLMKKEYEMKKDNEVSSKLVLLLYPINEAEAKDESEESYLFYEIMQKVEKQIHQFQYNLFFKSIPMQDNYKEEVEKILRFYQVEGMIVVGTQMSSQQIQNIYSIDIPIVVIDRFFREMKIDCIAFDNFAGAYEVVTYLIKKNHKKIGYVGTGSTNTNLSERREGYKAALEEQGGMFDSRYCIVDIKSNEKEKWQTLLKEPQGMPTAFLVENDYLAIDVIKELQSIGIRVPEEVSVIGFDNSVVADFVTPELTTMDIPWDKMARLSVERLMKKIKMETTDTLKTRISTEMVVRKSCQHL